MPDRDEESKSATSDGPIGEPGTSGRTSEQHEAVLYEGRGAGGVAVLVVLRGAAGASAVTSVRQVFARHAASPDDSGQQAQPEGQGAALSGFRLKGVLLVDAGASRSADIDAGRRPTAGFFSGRRIGTASRSNLEAERILEAGIEAGLEDLRSLSDGPVEAICDPDQVEALKTTLEKSGFAVRSSALHYLPLTTVEVLPEDLQSVSALTEALRQLPDVRAVYTNAGFADRSVPLQAAPAPDTFSGSDEGGKDPSGVL